MLQHYTTLSPRRVNVQDTTCQDSVLEIVHCVWMSFVPFISIEFREAAHVCEPHIPKQQAPMNKGLWENFLKNVEPSVRPGASVGSPGTTVTELSQDLHQSWAPMLVCKSQWSSWAETDPIHGRLFLRRTGQKKHGSHRFTELRFENVCECCPWAVYLF